MVILEEKLFVGFNPIQDRPLQGRSRKDPPFSILFVFTEVIALI